MAVIDHGDGSYEVRYATLVEKNVKLHVRVNGEAAHGSPYPLTVAHTTILPMRFMVLSPYGVYVNPDRTTARSVTNDNPRFALAGHSITTQDQPVWWKMKVNRMGKTNPYKCGFWLGVTANPMPSFD